MPRGQLRNCLSLEEMNHAVGMLESGVSQRRIAGILIVSLSMISRMESSSNLHTDMVEDATGLQLNVRTVFTNRTMARLNRSVVVLDHLNNR